MIYYGGNDYRDYIAHYGVVGMKWGVRRYQPYSYTEGRDGFRKGKEMGVARKLGDTAKRAGSAIKSSVKRAGSAIKTSIQTAKQNRNERKKEKVINSGDIKKVLKIKHKLTNEEIKRATDRIAAESKLKDLESQEAMRSIERGQKALSTLANITTSASTIYKNVSDIKEKIDKQKDDKEKAAKEKKVDAILRRGDAVEIERAIRSGQIPSNKIEEAKKVAVNMSQISNKAAELRDARMHDQRIIDNIRKEAREEVVNRMVESKAKEYNDRMAAKKAEVATTTEKPKVELTLDPFGTEAQKKTNRSNRSKKGWETRREKAAQNEKYRQEREARNAEVERKNSSRDEAIESWKARRDAKDSKSVDNTVDRGKAAFDSYVEYYKKTPVERAIESYKSERARKDAAEVSSKERNARISAGQERAKEAADKAMEELRKKGYAP